MSKDRGLVYSSRNQQRTTLNFQNDLLNFLYSSTKAEENDQEERKQEIADLKDALAGMKIAGGSNEKQSIEGGDSSTNQTPLNTMVDVNSYLLPASSKSILVQEGSQT